LGGEVARCARSLLTFEASNLIGLFSKTKASFLSRLAPVQIDYDDYESYLVDSRMDNDYIRAQQDGHFYQDCSNYEEECPTSLFGVNMRVTRCFVPKSQNFSKLDQKLF